MLEWIGTKGALTCPYCRAACDSIIPLIAPLVEKAARKRKRKRGQVEADDDDPSHEVSYVAGIRVSDDGEVSYKVVWAGHVSRAGKQLTQWVHAADMGPGEKVREFHDRYLIPPRGSFLFPHDIKFEFEPPVMVRGAAGAKCFKCPHCPKQHAKESNVRDHITCVHTKCPYWVCRGSGECAMSFSSLTNLLSHEKKFHGMPSK